MTVRQSFFFWMLIYYQTKFTAFITLHLLLAIYLLANLIYLL